MTDSSRAEAVRQVRVRPDIAALAPYTPTASLEVFAAQLERPVSALIKLDANENPYGPSPRARAALAALDTTHIYPDPEARALRALLSEYAGVDAAHILAGAGADELIALILQLFLAPGDAVVNAPPTFGMYAFDTPLAHGRVIDAPRRADFSLDVPAIEAAARDSGAKLLFICSPNNPDGSVIPPETVERLLALPLVVVLDEAYIEFSGAESLARRVPHTPNLIVLRTFSKWAGLAGLRVGYGIFPAEIIAHLWKIKQPYNVNVAADAAARASLADLPALRANVERLIAARERLERELATLPYLRPFPSRANFVLCRVIGLDAAELRRRLAHDYGILVRHYSAPLLRDCIRISAGTPEQIDALLRALREIGETDV
ncbi:MAG TPA: histidinol-phosphate transaminase [Aggregatilineaceae bacterium]|nr:histidinol-phosphate transaminase [Aggregatilineaceae bacterium]